MFEFHYILDNIFNIERWYSFSNFISIFLLRLFVCLLIKNYFSFEERHLFVQYLHVSIKVNYLIVGNCRIFYIILMVYLWCWNIHSFQSFILYMILCIGLRSLLCRWFHITWLSYSSMMHMELYFYGFLSIFLDYCTILLSSLCLIKYIFYYEF